MARKEETREPTTAEDSIYVASQWQLMWWRFRKHKMAMVSLVILAVMYFVAIFADFVAPYDTTRYSPRYVYAPPMRLRFVDEDGFHLRPFVYRVEVERGEFLELIFTPDESTQYWVKFFVKGDSYKVFGQEFDLHLFGIEAEDEDEMLYLLGADKLGRDYFSRVIHGARISLSIGLIGIAMSTVFGVLLGGISGYYGGVPDLIIQRIIEFLRSVPTIPLWMSLAAALPTDWPNSRVYFGITIILSLISWTGLARVTRGWFLALREEDFVMAARLAGASEFRIITRHMVPTFASYLIANLTLAIPGMILGETSLSFLGIGLTPPTVSWGVLLQQATNLRVVSTAPWIMSAAILVIITVLAFNFVGDGLRDAADPYSR
jgi:peptide/nickel transport system permease protein